MTNPLYYVEAKKHLANNKYHHRRKKESREDGDI